MVVGFIVGSYIPVNRYARNGDCFSSALNAAFGYSRFHTNYNLLWPEKFNFRKIIFTADIFL